MLRRLGFVLTVMVVVGTGLGVGSALASEFRPYSAPGEWFAPNHAESGYYDDVCWNWVNNTFSKSPTAWGVITFIDGSGGWRYGRQGYGVLARNLTWSEAYLVRKKPYCRNTTWSGYTGGCYGYIESASCA